MNLVALDKDTNTRIDITRCENPRLDLKAVNLICPLCLTPMIVVAGLIRMHHFRHKIKCDTLYESHPESFEHLKTKVVVGQKMKDWFDEFVTAEYELEVRIPEANRIADVLFYFPNGWRIACEVQLASITTEQLQKRTDDYLSAGIDTYWFLGKSADTPANREWSEKEYGFTLRLGFSESIIEHRVSKEVIPL